MAFVLGLSSIQSRWRWDKLEAIVRGICVRETRALRFVVVVNRCREVAVSVSHTRSCLPLLRTNASQYLNYLNRCILIKF